MNNLVIYNISKGPARYDGYSSFANLIIDDFNNEFTISNHDIKSTFTKFSCTGFVSAIQEVVNRYSQINKITIYTNNTKIFCIFRDKNNIIKECSKITDKTAQMYINKVLLSLAKLYDKFNCEICVYFLSHNDNNKYTQKCNKICNDTLSLCSTEYAIKHMK